MLIFITQILIIKRIYFEDFLLKKYLNNFRSQIIRQRNVFLLNKNISRKCWFIWKYKANLRDLDSSIYKTKTFVIRTCELFNLPFI